MSYPIYKLLRAVNRQYPNNGFINYVDVREDMYNHDLIDEDLRDLINETIQEVYKDVAIDEVYSFPTVPGQNQYVLPEDCDLRDIQEVTRTYQGWRGPLCPPPGPPPLTPVYTLFFDSNGGTGEMEPLECNIGESITLPECEFEPPEGKQFAAWEVNGTIYYPGDTVQMEGDFIATAKWSDVDPAPVWDHFVQFQIGNDYGTLSAPSGTMVGTSTAIYDNSTSSFLPELPTVTPYEGLTFLGWSVTGWEADIVPDATILATQIDRDYYYYGVFSGEGGTDIDPAPDWEDDSEDPAPIWDDEQTPATPSVTPEDESPLE